MPTTRAGCHGAEGKGRRARELLGSSRSEPAEELLGTILNGRGKMPAFGEKLPDQEAADPYAHLKSGFKN